MKKVKGLIHQLADTSDTILAGRKMAPGFIKHWEQAITQPENPEYSFAHTYQPK